MVDKNKYINEMMKDTKDKFYYKRIGKCDYKKCQAACCRFECVVGEKKKHKAQYLNAYSPFGVTDIRHINGYDVYIKPKWCDKIALNGKCKLHNNKRQPRVCKFFPMVPEDGMYIALKQVCGYKFKKIKNKNYMPKAKKVN